jgi:hypothetical protein
MSYLLGCRFAVFSLDHIEFVEIVIAVEYIQQIAI